MISATWWSDGRRRQNPYRGEGKWNGIAGKGLKGGFVMSKVTRGYM